MEMQHELEQAEHDLRLNGHNLPLAWGLGFFLDYEDVLIKLFEENNRPGLAEQVSNLVHEIRTGEVA